MPIHFSKAAPGTKCLVCGATIADPTTKRIGKSNIFVGKQWTNDPGLWNSFVERCQPRHHINVEAGKCVLVAVATEKHGPRPPDSPKPLE